MKNVLVLPGGGIRGHISAMACRDIELTTGLLAHEVFDLVVGTSTGGILGCAIGLGVPAVEVVDMYRDQGAGIFHRPWWSRVTNPKALRAPKYSPDGLREALYDVLGDEPFGRCLVPTVAVSRNFTRRREKLFESWEWDDGRVSMVDVCLATSAAPTYFPPHEIEGDLFIDGGMGANNPAAVAAAIAAEWYDEPFRVLTLGNGVDTSENHGRSALGWGVIRWAGSLVGEFMDAGTDLMRHLAEMIAFGRYVEIQPGDIAVAMDDGSDEAFGLMREAYEGRMQPYVHRVANLLANERVRTP